MTQLQDFPPYVCETELAWAAGFFEGEGTVAAKRAKARRQITGIQLSLPQYGGEEAHAQLVRFCRAVGAGNVTGPYDYSHKRYTSVHGTKPRYSWQSSAKDAVDAVMRKLLPYLTSGSPKWTKYALLLDERG